MRGSVWSLVFIPESKVLASGGADGKIILWDMDWSSLQKRACKIANRNLTKEEWKRYLEPYHGKKSYRGRCKEGAEKISIEYDFSNLEKKVKELLRKD